MKRNILPTLTPVLYTLLLLTLVSGSVNSQNEFITTWKTNNTGGPNDSTIYLPILAWPTTSYNVDWDNDGVADTLNLSGPVTLHFDSAGEYTIRITGTYPGFATGGAGSNELISIDQWGNNAWDTLSFQNSSNLIITSVDTPNLTALTHLDHLFDGASSLNSSVAHWDVSNITSMHAMFANTDSFDQSLATWNIESATDITDLFLNAGISTSNYDATLLSWSQQDVQPGLTFGGGSSRFCDAVEERRILMDSAGWTFTDGGYDFTCKPDENFVTQWKTNNSGATGNTSIRLPIYTDGGYYFVDWGDGSYSEYLTGNKTHTYSSAGTYTVTIWGSFPSLLFYSSSDSRKLLKISQWGTNAWNALRFQRCENLVIDAPDTPDLALINDMSNMFREARNFNSPIGHWDVSNVTNMASMFEEAEKFNQPLESWDVGNVTNMESMFAYAYDFNKPLNNWDVSRVKDMAYMFVEAEEFNQPLNNWDVDSVTNMRYMLLATKFNHPIGNWNVSSVTDMAGMFSITPYNHPLNDWDVSNVTDMSLMFESCDFNHPLDQWDVSNVKDMERMFAYGADFDQSLAAWQLDSVSDVSEMFNYSGMSTANYDSTLISWSQQDVPSGLNFHGGNSQFCEAVEARKILMDSAGWTFIDGGFDFTCKPGENFITQWKTNNSGATGSTSIRLPIYTDGGYYFVDWGDGSHSDYLTGNKTHTYSSAGTYTVTIWGSFPSLLFYSSGDSRKLLKISQWGTNAWTGLRFQRCQNLVIDAPDTPDLALVTDMSNMFREATNFNSPIGHWDVSTVTDMQSMFEEAEKFNQPLDSWDVGNVTNMESMFAYAYDFNKPLNNWDVSRVKDMAYMFVEAEEFNQPLNNWDVDSVTNMRYMLLATKFNHPIGNWNVSSVTDMVGMFSITPYNHPLNDWDVSNVTNMSLMFEACDFDHPLDQWDVSNVKNMKRMFAYGADFDQSLASWQVDSVSNFSEMFNYSGMSTVNYDSTLISWSQQNVLSGLSFHGGNSKFCAALDARKFLQDSLGWNISDAGYDFSCNEDIYFRTRWKTDNAGITGPQSLQLPIYGSDLHYYVDWGDGKTNEYTSANPSHDYSSAGFYVVKVVGDFSEFHTTGGDSAKLVTVQQWGPTVWDSLCFQGSTFLSISAIDTPDLSNITSMNSMFKNAGEFNNPIAHWDVSNVTDMGHMFENAVNFNQPLDAWDVSQVTDMSHMFHHADDFDQSLASWDVGSVQTMERMFMNMLFFDQPLHNWDVSNVINFQQMFEAAQSFDQSLGSWDISSATNMDEMLESTTLSTSNYDDILNGWAATAPPDINISFGSSQYCLGEDSRTFLIDSLMWSIADLGKECTGVATDWTGAIDTDWFKSGNWSHGVPTIGVVATVPYVATGAYPIIDSTGAECGELRCKSGSSVTIATGYGLYILR